MKRPRLKRLSDLSSPWWLLGLALGAVLIPLGHLHWAIGVIPALFLICSIAIVSAVRVFTRQFHFSLRTMFVVVTLFGVVCWLLGPKVTLVRQQREVVAWVKEMGGQVGYDFDYDRFGPDIRKWLERLQPLRELIGMDCDATVGLVTFPPNNTVSDLSPLAKLTNLRALSLAKTQVTDLSPLTHLTNLETLWLFDNPVSDDEIAELQKALPNCKVLRLPVEFIQAPPKP